MTPGTNPVLVVEGVSVRFGGLQAVQSVDLTVRAGTITGLIGPNGAGKTTTFNVISGLQRADSGVIKLRGRDITRFAPHRRARLGIARTFQRLETFGTLTARENVLVATEFHHGRAGADSDPCKMADALLERVGISQVAAERADTLPTGLARLLELARALATSPNLLLLDEPGSGLDPTETHVLGRLLLELVADGMAVLLVEHDVDLVMRVCADVNVMDFGRMIARGTPGEIQQSHEVQAAYLGAAVHEHHREPAGVTWTGRGE